MNQKNLPFFDWEEVGFSDLSCISYTPLVTIMAVLGSYRGLLLLKHFYKFNKRCREGSISPINEKCIN